MQGVYQIKHIVDGKAYVGSSRDIDSRRRWHLNALRGDYHQNIHLQRAWNKYGEENFVFEALEANNGSQEDLLDREQFWIDYYFEKEKAYNIATNAYGGDLGNEWRRLLSLARGGTGEPRPDSFCIDCGISISKGAARCQSCNAVKVSGNRIDPKYCIDCGVEISYGATRCMKCAGLVRRVAEYEGDEKPINRCVDCGKIICDVSTRCQSCAASYWHEQIKRK